MPEIVAETTATLTNLLAAFEGESNAHAKYTAFAAKADAEGWHGVASLFRAAARAEQIHANNHARVIKQLGGEAHCDIHPVDVQATLHNLKVALAGEQHEIDTMYPGFLIEASTANISAAIRTFTWAMEAEKTHARLYREAIEMLEEKIPETWAITQRDFYVCAVCGYTTDTPEEEVHCPVCNLPRERFEVIR